MAKNRAPSKRSRAARRETSPTIDMDKSLKDVHPPTRKSLRPNVLSLQRSAGITKKQSKRKTILSSKARKRYERGMQMAEAIEDRTRSKVVRSGERVKTVKNRSKAWEIINKEAEEEEAAGENRRGMFDLLATGANDGDEGQEEEEEEDDDIEIDGQAGVANGKRKAGRGGEEDDDGWETDNDMDHEGTEEMEQDQDEVQQELDEIL